MMPRLQNPLHRSLRVRDRRATFTLNLHQEPQELLRRHVRPASRILLERLLHVLRRQRIRDPKLPRKADAHSVTPHSLFSQTTDSNI